MEIRKLNEADYPAFLELFYALDQLHVEARPDWFQPRAKEDIFPQDAFVSGVRDPECLFLGAFDSRDTLVGIVRATLWDKSGMVEGLKNVCLDNIYVLPAFRRQGIAGQLYQAVADWARKQKAQRLELHVWDFNQDALAAYKAWQFMPQRYVLEQNLE